MGTGTTIGETNDGEFLQNGILLFHQVVAVEQMNLTSLFLSFWSYIIE